MVVCDKNGGIFSLSIQFNLLMPMSATFIETADVFLSDIAALETKITDLKEHYQTIQADQTAWTELQARQQVLAVLGARSAIDCAIE